MNSSHEQLFLYQHFLLLDIDECAERSAKCEQICENTEGSFICSCKFGWTLDVDGLTCKRKSESV